ncbi:unnamed protein product [Arabidopsis halleri]
MIYILALCLFTSSFCYHFGHHEHYPVSSRPAFEGSKIGVSWCYSSGYLVWGFSALMA